MAPRKLPPLSALPAFEATARLGSVTAAAEELGRTHGAVSKQIRHLADDLGVVLFERDGVGLRLTAAGARLQETVRSALDDLALAAAALRAEADGEVVEIGLSATLAMRWLMPRMPRFYRRRPGVEVRLRMTGRDKLRDASVDAVLSWDRLSWPLETREAFRPLGAVAFGVVHAPGYAAEALESGLRVETRIVHETTARAWAAWSTRTGLRLEAEHEAPYPHTFLALEAAAGGLGVALTERRLVEADLREGRLVAPLGFHRIEGGFGALVSPRAKARESASAFLDWLGEEAAG